MRVNRASHNEATRQVKPQNASPPRGDRKDHGWTLQMRPQYLTEIEPWGATGTVTGFLTRWAAAFLLLGCTFNPTQYNYVAWLRSYGSDNLSIAVLVGLLLVVGYVIYLRATMRSIGAGGMVLILAIVGATFWVLHDVGLLTLDDSELNTWFALGALSFVLGVGLNWSHVRRALSGQADMDDVDE